VRRTALAAVLAVATAFPAAAQDLLGHGGPVGALALSAGLVLSGSFDTRAILWDGEASALRVMRVHAGPVTAVAHLPHGWVATGGQDGRIAVWEPGAPEPRLLTAAGGAAIVGLVLEGADLRAALGPFAGHATLIRAAEGTRRALPPFPPEPAPVAALAAGLRARFDPRGILNPGLMD